MRLYRRVVAAGKAPGLFDTNFIILYTNFIIIQYKIHHYVIQNSSFSMQNSSIWMYNLIILTLLYCLQKAATIAQTWTQPHSSFSKKYIISASFLVGNSSFMHHLWYKIHHFWYKVHHLCIIYGRKSIISAIKSIISASFMVENPSFLV